MEFFPQLTLDIVNKSLGTSEILLDKDFKLWLHNISSTLVAVFVLSLSKIDGVIEE